MKAILAIFVLVSGFSAHAGTACEDYVDATEKFVRETEGRFNQGEVTRTDVAAAEAAAAKAKYVCNFIDKKTYCGVAVTAAETKLAGIKEEAKVGQRTTDDVVKAEFDLFTVRVLCE